MFSWLLFVGLCWAQIQETYLIDDFSTEFVCCGTGSTCPLPNDGTEFERICFVMADYYANGIIGNELDTKTTAMSTTMSNTVTNRVNSIGWVTQMPGRGSALSINQYDGEDNSFDVDIQGLAVDLSTSNVVIINAMTDQDQTCTMVFYDSMGSLCTLTGTIDRRTQSLFFDYFFPLSSKTGSCDESSIGAIEISITTSSFGDVFIKRIAIYQDPALTSSQTPTSTQTPTGTGSPSPTGTPSHTPTSTQTHSSTGTPSPTSSPSQTPSSTQTHSSTGTPSPTGTPSHTSTSTQTPTSSPSPSSTGTPSPTGTPSHTPTGTQTGTPTRASPSGTSTPNSFTPSATATSTSTGTSSASSSPTSTGTSTSSSSPTSTGTPTSSSSPTSTGNSTSTRTPSSSSSPTSTTTSTSSSSTTSTGTSTGTSTLTSSSSPTQTSTPKGTSSTTSSIQISISTTSTAEAALPSSSTSVSKSVSSNNLIGPLSITRSSIVSKSNLQSNIASNTPTQILQDPFQTVSTVITPQIQPTVAEIDKSITITDTEDNIIVEITFSSVQNSNEYLEVTQVDINNTPGNNNNFREIESVAVSLVLVDEFGAEVQPIVIL